MKHSAEVVPFHGGKEAHLLEARREHLACTVVTLSVTLSVGKVTEIGLNLGILPRAEGIDSACEGGVPA